MIRPARPAHPKRSSLLPAVCALVLVGLALAVECAPSAGLQGYAERSKPELIHGQDRITTRNAAFLREGLLKMSATFCEPEQLAADSPEAIALYGQVCPAPDAAKLQRDMPPSTALMPPIAEAAPEGIAVVSLVCRSDHLFDPEHGIVMNPMETGRHSERPAWLSARLGSKMIVESPIGLRIHGGFSRRTPHQSFSLVFRESYGGHARCTPGLFFGSDTPPASHIVLVNGTDPSKFKAALGTEIATMLGCNTSRFTPALVYLNGTLIKSPFFLYQHQSPDFVKERFDIAEVDWERVKANRERENAAYVKWRQWIRRDRFPNLLSEEAERFDISDLSSWALTMSFTSTADNHQGGYFRDRTDPDAVWRSLVWDMDCAFTHDLPSMRIGPHINDDDPFPWLFGDRGRLFHRLMERTPEYRDWFRQFVHAALRTRLPREKLMALADRYVDLAKTHPVTRPEIVRTMEDARQFLSTRHDFFLPYLDHQIEKEEAKPPYMMEAVSAN